MFGSDRFRSSGSPSEFPRKFAIEAHSERPADLARGSLYQGETRCREGRAHG
jgi:hypothetical protein